MKYAPKLWNADHGLWLPSVPKSWDGYGWSRPVEDYTTVRRTPFKPYLAEGTVWTRDVSEMPLATKSADFAAWMAANINYGAGFGPTSLNSSVFGTHPIQVHLVDSSLSDHKAYVTGTFPGGGGGFGEFVLGGWVPWPEYETTVQTGQDSAITIIDVATGIIREYYYVVRVAGTKNRYTTTTGGYSIAPRELLGWAETNYSTQLTEGSSAVAMMHNHFGFIGIEEALNGQINHALAYTCSNMNVPTSTGEAIRLDDTRYQHTGASWPAKSGDGDTVSDDAPIHGQWARLPQGLDLQAYKPFTRLLIQAAQTYGMVATDTNNFVHAFNTEHGGQWKAMLGTDPWAVGGAAYEMWSDIADQNGYQADKPFDVSDFPWHLTEWAPRNWGMPE